MKLKKKVKRIIIILIVLLLIGVGFFINKNNNSSNTKNAKILSEIKEYGYKLKDTKSRTYQEMFKKLKEILEGSNVDEEDYVKQISKMFVYDFYSLKDKAAKTDVGGTDFVYSGILDNFLLNAEDTYYKYVESNIYNNRKQSLPEVDESKIKIIDIKQEEYSYNDESDEKAYIVKVKWDYTNDKFSDYQKEATLTFIHDGKKLCLVELQ